ncbi:MAG: glycoside hydrolase [Opitutaceae bacterium]|jgi:sialidase-1|nr:glycoside hydrolase [Opitutaceae bacterium]
MKTKLLPGILLAVTLLTPVVAQPGQGAAAAPTARKGAVPLIEKFQIFTAGKDGYANYRIPGIVLTTKGTVLAFCDARKDSKLGDWSTIEIFMRRSTTGGRTWEPQKKIIYLGLHEKHGYTFERSEVAVAQGLGKDGQRPITNQLPVVDRQTGTIFLFHCVEQARCFLMNSTDDGVTWSPPVEVTNVFDGFKKTYPWKVLATGPAHGIQLANGRMIVPVWLSRGGGYNGHRPSVVSTIYSDDHGRTWHCGEIAADEKVPLINPNETVAIQLADGRVMLNMRNESPEHRRGIAISPDGATRWSKPIFDNALKEPICMAGFERLSTVATHGKNRILFSNPDNDRDGDHTHETGGLYRKNLSLKLSYDEGKTWPVNKVLEPGPSGYSDLAILDDGTILCLYEDGLVRSGSRFPAKYITLARFNLEWLTDGNDTLSK